MSAPNEYAQLKHLRGAVLAQRGRVVQWSGSVCLSVIVEDLYLALWNELVA